MIGGVQWNTKSAVLTVVTGIVILFAGYNMWQTQDAVEGAEAGAKISKKEDNTLRVNSAASADTSKGASKHTTSGMKTFPNVVLKDFDVDKGQAAPADVMKAAKNITEKEIKVEIGQVGHLQAPVAGRPSYRYRLYQLSSIMLMNHMLLVVAYWHSCIYHLPSMFDAS